MASNSVRTTVHGSVAGLLRSGSPLWWRDEETPYVCVSCVSPDDGMTWEVTAVPRSGIPLALTDDASNFELDLETETGQFHAICWLRERGHPGMGWMMDLVKDEAGTPDVRVSAQVLAQSVMRVAAGMSPIVDVLEPWNEESGQPMRDGLMYLVAVMPTLGWQIMRFPDSPPAVGPESGEEGKAAADRAAMGLGIALLDVDGSIRFPEISVL